MYIVYSTVHDVFLFENKNFYINTFQNSKE